jgi:hypothetical protein
MTGDMCPTRFASGQKVFARSGPERPIELSVAEILIQLLASDWSDFTQFVQNAHYSDARQTAALDYLGKELGEVIAGILGAGNWRPNRKAVAGLLKQYLRPSPARSKNESAQDSAVV